MADSEVCRVRGCERALWAKGYCEGHYWRVRRHGRQELEKLEKENGLSKDEIERVEKVLDKMTQEHVDIIDKAAIRKEQEVMEV